MSDQTRPPSRIPEFSSVQEEAEWWDTHDITDYLDELRPVHVTFGPKVVPPLPVRLDSDERAELDRRAEARGSDAAALVAEWVRERLRAEAG